MAWIISKKRVLFQKDRVEQDSAGNRVQIVEDTFVLQPNAEDLTQPVFVPDWVKGTEMFALLDKEGSIQETLKGPVVVNDGSQQPQAKAGATGLPKQHAGTWQK